MIKNSSMPKESGIIISGKVIHGEKYGRALGFPTANLDRRDYVRRKLKIRLGIYAGQAGLPSARKYQAAIVIGPVDEKRLPKVEVHIINFKGNLYGKKIIITLKKFIRPFKKFQNERELKKQIGKDLEIIKQIKYGN
jgi:riboflavin kinase / FMN adenylyltransferase